MGVPERGVELQTASGPRRGGTDTPGAQQGIRRLVEVPRVVLAEAFCQPILSQCLIHPVRGQQNVSSVVCVVGIESSEALACLQRRLTEVQQLETRQLSDDRLADGSGGARRCGHRWPGVVGPSSEQRQVRASEIRVKLRLVAVFVRCLLKVCNGGLRLPLSYTI